MFFHFLESYTDTANIISILKKNITTIMHQFFSFQINFKNPRLFCELSQLSVMSALQKDIKNHLHAKKFQRKNIYVIL